VRRCFLVLFEVEESYFLIFTLLFQIFERF
jgi:hypothetical protein